MDCTSLGVGHVATRSPLVPDLWNGLDRWADPVEDVATDWPRQLVPYYEALATYFEPMQSDVLAAAAWKAAHGLFDVGPEPRTVELQNERWREFVAAIWKMRNAWVARRLEERRVRLAREHKTAGTCQRCGAAIFFGRTHTNSMVPFDVEPVAAGALAPAHRWRFDRLSVKATIDERESGQAYLPHFATCPTSQRGAPKTPIVFERWAQNRDRLEGAVQAPGG